MQDKKNGRRDQDEKNMGRQDARQKKWGDKMRDRNKMGRHDGRQKKRGRQDAYNPGKWLSL